MNLGDTYFEAGMAICVGACLMALPLALMVRYVKKVRAWTLLAIFVICAGAFSYGGCTFLHRPLFTAWHQSRNTALPRTGCLTYDPSFFRLFASYQMSRAEFERWVKRHHWQLAPLDDRCTVAEDVKRPGCDQPDAAYASQPKPNGSQLRVYHSEETMYVSYWAM